MASILTTKYMWITETDQKSNYTRLNKPNIFDLEKLVVYWYKLACLGDDNYLG